MPRKTNPKMISNGKGSSPKLTIDTTELEIGQIFKNYKEMCKFFNMEPTDGNAKKAQLKEIQRYMELERDKQRYIITDIYDKPLDRDDARICGNNNVYAHSIELLLLRYLSLNQDHTIIISKRHLIEMLGMVSPNYYLYEMNEEKRNELLSLREENDFDEENCMTEYEINNFYFRCNKRLEQILFSALSNLEKRKLIICNRITCIINKDGSEYIANTSEQEQILEVERDVLLQMGFFNIGQVFCSFRQKEYFRNVKDRLHKLHGWQGYYRRIRLIYSQKNAFNAIEETAALLERALLNSKVINSIEQNAKHRYETEKQKYEEWKLKELPQLYKNKMKDEDDDDSDWGEPDNMDIDNIARKLGKFVIPETYLKAQKLLTDELIWLGHEPNKNFSFEKYAAHMYNRYEKNLQQCVYDDEMESFGNV